MTQYLIRTFIRDYNNMTDPRTRERYGKFSGIVGIASNLILFGLKISAGLLFGSISVIADALNNLSDSGSSIVSFIGFKLSEKPADSEHPYGHARMEYLSGLIVSFSILLVGFQMLKSSWDKTLHPEPLEFSLITVAILAVSIGMKIWQAGFYRKIGQKIASPTVTATAADSRNDVLATSAVLVSLLISNWTGFNLDGYMGIAVSLFIMYSGITLIMETANPLLGIAPSEEFIDSIYQKILSYEGIIGLHDLNVHNYGPSKCFASVHCEVPADRDIMLSHDLIDNIERDFYRDLGIRLVIHLDPVAIDDAKTSRLKVQVTELLGSIAPGIRFHDFRVVWGLSHTNILFDVVTPFDYSMPDRELIRRLVDAFEKIDPTFRLKITVDHASYVPSDRHDAPSG